MFDEHRSFQFIAVRATDGMTGWPFALGPLRFSRAQVHGRGLVDVHANPQEPWAMDYGNEHGARNNPHAGTISLARFLQGMRWQLQSRP
jgi:hypothetical protein